MLDVEGITKWVLNLDGSESNSTDVDIWIGSASHWISPLISSEESISYTSCTITDFRVSFNQ